jgi:hypothetical protein
VVRTEPSIPPVIDAANRTLANHSRPEQLINILGSLHLSPDDTHRLYDTPAVPNILNEFHNL